MVLKYHPELLEVSGDNNKVREAIIKAMIDVWPKVGRELMNNLIDSMTTRVNAVLLAEGWYIRF